MDELLNARLPEKLITGIGEEHSPAFGFTAVADDGETIDEQGVPGGIESEQANRQADLLPRKEIIGTSLRFSRED